MALPVPDFPFEVEEIFDVDQTPPRSAQFFAQVRQPSNVRKFRLAYPNLELSERNAIVSDFESALGTVGTLSFTPPDEVSALTVQFDEASLTTRWVQPNRWEVSLVLEVVQ